MPGEDEALKLFTRAISRRETQNVLLKSAKSEFSNELNTLQETGENIAETIKKLFKGKKDEHMPKSANGTTPTISQERYEDSFMNTNLDAQRSVMRPNAPVIGKKSALFKNVEYEVSVSNIVSKRQVGHNTILARDLDLFDKTATFNIQKLGNGGYTKFSTGAGYNFFKKRVKIDAHYTMPRHFIRGRVYLEKDNPGINAEYIKQMPKDGSLNINGGVFKEDAAFQVEYKTPLDKNTKMVIGAYGTTKYKETGVYGRLEF